MIGCWVLCSGLLNLMLGWMSLCWRGSVFGGILVLAGRGRSVSLLYAAVLFCVVAVSPLIFGHGGVN